PAVGSPLAPARDIAQLRHILNFTWRENSPRKTSDMPRRVIGNKFFVLTILIMVDFKAHFL
ncbi:MAG: hypothetical protein Q8Q86_00700, partial [Candidatus Daviesbacteria bacterium]|nr:hypothetical protein [Candidatus Daviesbacteria bacterium]